MPLYEYVCSDCDVRFDQLRPIGHIDEPADCPGGHSGARRVLSTFAALTRDGYGEAVAIGGDRGCTNCACSAN